MNIKKILITGGTGSLGQALVRHFLNNKNLRTIKHYKKNFKAKLVENNFHYDSSSNKDFLTIKELGNIISKN